MTSARTDDESLLRVVHIRGRRQANLFWYHSSELRRVIRALRPDIIDLHEEPFSLAAAGVLWAMSREHDRQDSASTRRRICQNVIRRRSH